MASVHVNYLFYLSLSIKKKVRLIRLSFTLACMFLFVSENSHVAVQGKEIGAVGFLEANLVSFL